MPQVTLTVKRIFLNCDSFRQTRLKYYLSRKLKYLFKNSKPEDFLSFLKKLFSKI